MLFFRKVERMQINLNDNSKIGSQNGVYNPPKKLDGSPEFVRPEYQPVFLTSDYFDKTLNNSSSTMFRDVIG